VVFDQWKFTQLNCYRYTPCFEAGSCKGGGVLPAGPLGWGGSILWTCALVVGRWPSYWLPAPWELSAILWLATLTCFFWWVNLFHW